MKVAVPAGTSAATFCLRSSSRTSVSSLTLWLVNFSTFSPKMLEALLHFRGERRGIVELLGQMGTLGFALLELGFSGLQRPSVSFSLASRSRFSHPAC